MYIVPNSTVYILSGISINKNYQHTIYFDDVGAQFSYFYRHVKKKFTGVSYQREKRGWMLVECPADELYNCNYLMYQNTAYNNKWFYAFIDSVKFVNNITCEVTFTLDVMQTWFFDYTLQACFVDREHSATDNYFEHTIPENLGFGELIIAEKQFENSPWFKADGIVFSASEAPPSIDGTPKVQTKAYGVPCNMYIRCSAFNWLNPDVASINSLGVLNDLQSYIDAGKYDAIQSVFFIPRFMCADSVDAGAFNGAQPPESVVTFTFTATLNLGSLGGYIPRNKKLYCYPYNRLRVSNSSGQAVDYRFEDWNKNEDGSPGVPKFIAYGASFNNPQVVIVPTDYKNSPEYFDESLTISGYPPMPFLGDMLTAYLALNSNTLNYQKTVPVYNFARSLVNTAANIGGSALAGDVTGVFKAGLGAAASGINALIDYGQIHEEQMAKQRDMAEIPDTVHNLSNTTSVALAANKLRPILYQMCCKPEYFKTLDGYFDRWGYKCNEVKIPNRNVRPHWTYTKTNACTINANCPGDDEDMICKIYDNGITFWRNGDEVGDYTLDNSPT